MKEIKPHLIRDGMVWKCFGKGCIAYDSTIITTYNIWEKLIEDLERALWHDMEIENGY